MALTGLARQQAARLESLDTLSRMRREAREEINRLIQFLDDSDQYVMTELEDDGDLEDVGDTEPSLGSFDGMLNQERSYRQVFGEVIPSVDAELDGADNEPSLGACEEHPATPPMVFGHFGPVLGCRARHRSSDGDQTLWAAGSKDDREDDAGDNPEHDESETGIADDDGLREQFGRQVF